MYLGSVFTIILLSAGDIGNSNSKTERRRNDRNSAIDYQNHAAQNVIPEIKFGKYTKRIRRNSGKNRESVEYRAHPFTHVGILNYYVRCSIFHNMLSLIRSVIEYTVKK